MTSIQYLAISEIIDSGKSSKNKEREKYWSINLDQIESHTGKVISWDSLNINEIGSSTHFFEKGTVLYSKLRPYLNKVVLADRDGYATTELVSIRCNVKIALPEYVAYFLRSPKFLKFAENLVAGAKMPRMVMSEFWKYKIPIPSLAEQRRIAAILDKAEALRAKRREAIAKLDQLLQSVFLEMFTEGEKVIKPINECLTKIIDYRGKTPEKSDSGIPLITAKIIKNMVVQEPFEFIKEEIYSSWMTRGTPSSNAVLITTEAPMGQVALMPKYKAALAQRVLCLEPKSEILDSTFLMHCLRSEFVVEQLNKFSTGSTVSGIRQAEFKKIEIPIPPIENQKKFRKIAEVITIKKQKHHRFLDFSEKLITSIENQFFN